MFIYIKRERECQRRPGETVSPSVARPVRNSESSIALQRQAYMWDTCATLCQSKVSVDNVGRLFVDIRMFGCFYARE